MSTCKMIISSGIISIFLRFWIFGLLRGKGGVKGQKMAQDDKKNMIIIWKYKKYKYISYDCHLWYTFVKWWCLKIFHFFKILILWVVKGGEGAKNGPIWEKFCLLCSISQEPYTIRLFKMIVSPGVFYFFKILFF